MDIEQLKLVLETLQGLGHETSNLAVIWLSLEYGTMVFGWIISVGVITYVARLIYRAVTPQTREGFFMQMRDQLRIGTRGAMTKQEMWDTQQAISAIVHQHLAAKQGEK